MKIEDLARELAERNIILTARGERLACNAPAGALTPELRDIIARHKPALLHMLTREEAAGGPVPPAPRDGPIPLTDEQQRLWFIERLRPSHAYNLTAFQSGPAGANVAALEKAIACVLDRHEALRTSFSEVDGAPRQCVQATAPVALEILDAPGPGAPGDVRATLEELSRTHFDLTRAPLWRTALVRGAGSATFAVVVHHIVADGIALDILMEEIGAAYTAFAAGRAPALPAVPIQYPDYAVWRHRQLSGPRLRAQVDWWRERLQGIPEALELPLDRPRTTVQDSEGGSVVFHIPPDVAADMREVCRKERVTLFVLLLAALKILLRRYSGQTSIAVGTPVTHRTTPELERVVGHFANTLVMRTEIGAEMTVRDAIQAVRETALESQRHSGAPFEAVVDAVRPSRSLSHSPLFQVAFVLDHAYSGAAYETLSSGAMFDLSLYTWEAAGGSIGVTLHYRTALFDRSTIERMAGHFSRIASLLAGSLNEPVGRLDMLAPEERAWLLEDCNRTAVAYPREACVHSLFLEQAKLWPEKVAVIETGSAAEGREQVSLTYAELDRRSGELAEALRAAGVGPGVAVGVALERSAGAIVCFLAALRAGGAYVPLDPGWPVRRLEYMVKDAGLLLVLANAESAESLERFGAPVLAVDRPLPRSLPRASAAPGAGSPAYVMYTSGSTGEPKGVCVPHRGIVRLVMNADYMELSASTVILACAPVTFDAATLEIWGALLNGGTVAVLTDRIPTPRLLHAAIARHGVDTLWLTAGLFHQLVDEDVACLAGVRQVLAGGDVVSPAHVNRLLACPGQRVVINGYGPTENTTFTCCHAMASGSVAPSPVPIGRPIANSTAYVLDAHLQPTPIGVAGELYAGGDGLALGYLNQPELTASRFIPHPYSTEPGARLYRTGDVVRRLAGGEIEFLRREDTQVKIRGFRIETGEIEAALLRHPGVRQCVVVCRAGRGGSKYLAAYVVPRGAPADTFHAELRESLSAWLPEYMAPAAFVTLAAAPLTANGKLDRAALPEPACTPLARLSARTPLEAEILQAWRATLGIAEIGVNENFFDSGGHSLLAVKLFSILEKRFGPLPLSLLFEAPTVEQMARKLAGSERAAAWRSLVPIQAAGDQPPLFLAPGLGGNVLCFGELASVFAGERPVYGLQSAGLDGTRPFETIEEIATHFNAELRAVQPSGPYHVAGVCMGGAVAWEMCQQLRAAGHEVALLCLVETWPPHELHDDSAPKLQSLAGMRFSNMLRAVFCAGPEARRAYLRKRRNDVARILRGEPPAAADLSDHYRARVAAANAKAFARYRPKPYPGEVAFFMAAQRRVARGPDPRNFWVSLARRSRLIHMLDGLTSGELLKGRAVRELAANLKSLLAVETSEREYE